MKQLLVFVALWAVCANGFAAQRTALVIGNGAYESAPLKNPVNDAQDMTRELGKRGFAVIYRQNVDRKKMREAIRDFTKAIQQGGVGLFYFAGHGIQVDGENYLMPIGSDVKLEYEVVDEGIGVNSILRGMENAGNEMNVVILDACRNNPFANSFRSSARGLSKVDAPAGSLVAYATGPGSVAADSDGRNSVYTKHLLEAMKTPGLDLEDVFKQVRVGVERDTGGRQVPWEESSLRKDFYFMEEYAQSVASAEPRGQSMQANGVSILLSECDAHFNAKRLKSSSGANAWDCYQTVLHNHPGTREALDGLLAVENQYISWTKKALQAGNTRRAQLFMAKLKEINPDRPAVWELEDRLAAMTPNKVGVQIPVEPSQQASIAPPAPPPAPTDRSDILYLPLLDRDPSLARSSRKAKRIAAVPESTLIKIQEVLTNEILELGLFHKVIPLRAGEQAPALSNTGRAWILEGQLLDLKKGNAAASNNFGTGGGKHRIEIMVTVRDLRNSKVLLQDRLVDRKAGGWFGGTEIISMLRKLTGKQAKRVSKGKNQ